MSTTREQALDAHLAASDAADARAWRAWRDHERELARASCGWCGAEGRRVCGCKRSERSEQK